MYKSVSTTYNSCIGLPSLVNYVNKNLSNVRFADGTVFTEIHALSLFNFLYRNYPSVIRSAMVLLSDNDIHNPVFKPTRKRIRDPLWDLRLSSASVQFLEHEDYDVSTVRNRVFFALVSCADFYRFSDYNVYPNLNFVETFLFGLVYSSPVYDWFRHFITEFDTKSNFNSKFISDFPSPPEENINYETFLKRANCFSEPDFSDIDRFYPDFIKKGLISVKFDEWTEEEQSAQDVTFSPQSSEGSSLNKENYAKWLKHSKGWKSLPERVQPAHITSKQNTKLNKSLTTKKNKKSTQLISLEREHKNNIVMSKNVVFEPQMFGSLSDSLRNILPNEITVKHEMPDSIAPLIVKLNAMIDTVSSSYTSFTDSPLGHFMSTSINALSHPAVVIPAACIMAWHGYKKKSVICSAGAVALAGYALKNLTYDEPMLKEALTSYFSFENNEDLEFDGVEKILSPQSVSTPISSIQHLRTFIGSTILASTLSKLTDFRLSTKSIATLMMGFANFDRAITGFQSFMSFVKMAIQAVDDFIRENILQKQRRELFPLGIERVDSWINDVNAIVDERNMGKLPLTLESYDRVTRMRMEADAILVAYSRKPNWNCVSSMVNKWLRYMQPIQDLLAQANLGLTETRMEPLVIAIVGDPGCGKTKMSVPFVQQMLKRVLGESDLKLFLDHPDAFSYTHWAENPFWDGYKGQICCVCDDMFQVAEGGDPSRSEALWFMRMVSPFPLICNMADLSQKGNTIFTSSVIFATSNSTQWSPNSINYKDALCRRVDLPYKVGIKKEFQRGGTKLQFSLDTSKVGKDVAFNPGVYEFLPWDLQTNCPTGPPISWDELLEISITKYKQKKKVANEFAEYLAEQRAEALIPIAAVPLSSDVDITKSVKDAELLMLDMGSISCDGDTPSEDIDWSNEEAVLAFATAKPVDPNDSLLSGKTVIEELKPQAYEEAIVAIKEPEMDMFITQTIMDHAHEAHRSFNGSFDSAKAATFIFLTDTVPNFCKMKKFKASVLTAVVSKLVPSHKWIEFRDMVICMSQYVDKTCRSCSKHSYEAAKRMIETCKNLCPSVNESLKYLAIASAAVVTTATLCAAGHALMGGTAEALPAIMDAAGSRQSGETNLQYSIRDVKGHLKDRKQRAEMSAKFLSQGNDGSRKKHWSKLDDILSPQMVNDKPLYDAMRSIIDRNTYEIYDSRNQRYGSMVVVKNRMVLMPLHYFAKFLSVLNRNSDNLEDWKLVNRRTNKDYTVTVKDLCNVYNTQELDDNELVLCDIPTFPVHKDITQRFVKESFLKNKPGFRGALYELRDKEVMYYECPATSVSDRLCRDGTGSEYIIARGLHYRAPLDKGDCGSLFGLSCSDPHVGILAGIHTAGSDGEGLSAVVTREWITKQLAEATSWHTKDLAPQGADLGYLFNDEDFPVRRLDSFCAYRQSRSGIMPTKLQNTYAPCTKKLARLTRFIDDTGVKVDPMHKALRGYIRPPVKFEPEILAKAEYDLEMHLCNTGVFDEAVNSRILTFDEAIKGAPDLKNVPAISRKTSPGWPYNVPPNVVTKKEMFGEEEVPCLDGKWAKDLRLNVDKMNDQLLRGERVYLPFTGMLKDEPVSEEKYNIGKTRYVSACSIYAYVLFKMYFGHFAGVLADKGLAVGTVMGIDPTSEVWHIMGTRLLAKNPKEVADGDFAGYDLSMVPEGCAPILRIINKWYDDEFSEVRCLLWMCIVMSAHIIDGKHIQLLTGEPSGHLLTTTLNCLANILNFRYIWYDIMRGTPFLTYQFSNWVELFVMGDDNIYTVHPRVAKLFNADAIVKAFAKIGFTYTLADKSSGVNTWKPLEECSFLKRTFRWEPVLNRYVGPLALSSILNTPMWCKKGLDEVGKVRENVESSFRELSLHDEETYKHWTGVIQKEMIRAYGHKHVVPAGDRISNILNLAALEVNNETLLA